MQIDALCRAEEDEEDHRFEVSPADNCFFTYVRDEIDMAQMPLLLVE